MPSAMMVRLPDLVDMHPQNVFITDIVPAHFLQPSGENKVKQREICKLKIHNVKLMGKHKHWQNWQIKKTKLSHV